MSNRISVIVDVTVDRANAALGSFRKSVADADGSVNKFKAGAGAAMDSVKANAGNLAMAGGAALVAFGAKAVDEFNKLAIESGKLSDALGIPVDDMSRLIEVAGDLGIETSALESTIGKMNRTAASTPDAFEAINAQIVKNADGTTNVNETFLATVDALRRIPDATKRAEAAQQIFGRSWQNIAELVGQGSEEIRKSLQEVSDQKIIDESEVESAREYRAAMDALNDAIQDISLAAGQVLTPVLTDAAEIISGLTDGVKAADKSTGGWASKLAGLGNVFSVTKDLWDKGPGSLIAMATATDDAAESTDSLAGSMVQASIDAALLEQESANLAAAQDDAAQAYIDHARGMRRESQETADKLTADWDRITGKITSEQEFIQAKNQFQDLREAALEALAAGEEGADNYRLAQLEAQGALVNYLEKLGDVPPEVASDIIAKINRGDLDAAEAALNNVARSRSVMVTAKYAGGYDPRGGIDGNPATPFAKGGIVTGPTNALIGEAGREAVIPLDSPTADRMLGGLGGGTNIVINMPPGSDGDSVVRALRTYVRRNGPIQGIT